MHKLTAAKLQVTNLTQKQARALMLWKPSDTFLGTAFGPQVDNSTVKGKKKNNK